MFCLNVLFIGIFMSFVVTASPFPPPSPQAHSRGEGVYGPACWRVGEQSRWSVWQRRGCRGQQQVAAGRRVANVSSVCLVDQRTFILFLLCPQSNSFTQQCVKISGTSPPFVYSRSLSLQQQLREVTLWNIQFEYCNIFFLYNLHFFSQNVLSKPVLT